MPAELRPDGDRGYHHGLFLGGLAVTLGLIGG
jgi:hypothetical protein